MLDTPTLTAEEVDEMLDMLDNTEALLGQLRARLASHAGKDPDQPVLSARDLARIEKLGEVAHLHLAHLEEHGQLTLGDSLEIRHRLYGTGDAVRSTANLFGRRGSRALFYRQVDEGTPRDNSQPVALTDEGERIARLWRQLHPQN